MDKAKFIYQIESERHFNCITRILMAFSRRRIPILEMQAANKEGEDTQKLTICIIENKETAIKISKSIAREIDVLTVHLFEHTFSESNN